MCPFGVSSKNGIALVSLIFIHLFFLINLFMLVHLVAFLLPLRFHLANFQHVEEIDK